MPGLTDMTDRADMTDIADATRDNLPGSELRYSLRERIKELSCLYGISKIIDQHHDDLDAVMEGIVNLLPPSWQYPSVACGRIRYMNKLYQTANYQETAWKQIAQFSIGHEQGTVEVGYLQEQPESDEGPFLKEERFLIDAIAERIGKVIERINLNERLVLKQETLKNMNITLRGVLKQIEGEKRAIETRIQDAMGKIVMPIIYALEVSASTDQRAYIELLRTNLREITCFTTQLPEANMHLTPNELQICNMIKNGLSTKEIARLRRVSPSTVSNHRENIRRKLNIANKPVNLSTYLISMTRSDEQPHRLEDEMDDFATLRVATAASQPASARNRTTPAA